MKILSETKEILESNKAETMVEVIVAFLVLSIVMVLFAQGMRYATSAETFAVDNARACDEAMLRLQKTVTGNEDAAVRMSTENVALGNQSDMLKLSNYSVVLTDGGDTNVFYYWVFDANVE